MNKGYIPPVVITKAKNTAWETLPNPTLVSAKYKEPCLFQTFSISPDASRLLYEILDNEFNNPDTKYNTHLLGIYLEFLMYTPFKWIDNS
jgi:hypothetical protein